MSDELREQLGRLDPMHPGVPVEPATTPSSRALMEKIMNTPLTDRTESPATASESTPIGGRRRRTRALLGVAAATVVAIGGFVIVNTAGDGDDSEVAGPPMELSLGDAGAAMSCMQFDPALLAGMSTAFSGTATSVEGEKVTLTVDRWFAGGDAATVELSGAAESAATIAGFEFEVGQSYLITAAEGTVNYCGYSGPASPELTAAFEAAFPG